MNRINTYFIVLLSLASAVLVVFLFFRERERREPKDRYVPLRVEVYRVDRNPLPEADIYLNQKYLGKSDERGFFSREMNLQTGETYTLRIEREGGGFAYGPWETRFKVEEELEAPQKKTPEAEPVSSLEGESDIESELERATSGKAGVYGTYHFLALLDGYMYYTVRVSGRPNAPDQGATVIVNGKVEGVTDSVGALTVRYSGEEARSDGIQVIKPGRHIWVGRAPIGPDAVVDVILSNMLLVDFTALTEQYGVLKGIEGALVSINGREVGRTGSEGFFSFEYRNELGVDGALGFGVKFPAFLVPESLSRTFMVAEGLPRLVVTDFAYPKQAVQPRIAVMPLALKGKGNLTLEKQAATLNAMVEDYLASDGAYTLASSDAVRRIFRQFDLDFTKEGVSWKDIPHIKREVDAVVFGSIESAGGELEVFVRGVDYTGETFYEAGRRASPRELLSTSEEIVEGIRSRFPLEGNMLSIGNKLYLNLGSRHGVEVGDRFNGFIDFYDEIKKTYAKKRVVRLKVTETGETFAAAEMESVSEGYLLEAGVKVKRSSEPDRGGKTVEVVFGVLSGGLPVPDANVYVDDQWAGQTDSGGTLVLSLPHGASVELLAYRDGYVPGTAAVKVSEGMAPLSIDLARGETLLSVDSDPHGAILFIDGEYKGTTPILGGPVFVPYGFHRLELELQGHLRYSRYLNFAEPQVSFTGKERIILHRDLLRIAEQRYADHNIYGAVSILKGVPGGHPDYLRALERLGYIHLRDLGDYGGAIRYYEAAVEYLAERQGEAESLLLYYNAGQAHLGMAEELFFTSGETAVTHFMKAAFYFSYLRDRKNRVSGPERAVVNQNTLYSLAVCYQKMYYLTENEEHIERARYAWNDYFDFFDEKLLEGIQFRKQFEAAKVYREEAERLRGGR